MVTAAPPPASATAPAVPAVPDANGAANNGHTGPLPLLPPDRRRLGGAFDVSIGTGLPSLELETDASIVRATADGVRLDLGGIGKGYACERAAEILATAGPCLVNAGGDIATRAGTWTVSVETASEPLTLELSGSNALATSGRDLRRWRRGGREVHHLIDPATGLPSMSDLLRVTAVAHDAIDAEVTAKDLFLVGADSAREEADHRGVPALLVTRDGRTILAGGLA